MEGYYRLEPKKTNNQTDKSANTKEYGGEESYEVLLRAILDKREDYKRNVIITALDVPKIYQGSIYVDLQKLKSIHAISAFRRISSNEWEVCITILGARYFKHKKIITEDVTIDDGSDSVPPNAPQKHDVFISHASKDKLDYVEELYQTIMQLGIDVYYDRTSISWGDDWKKSILKGTAESEFAIIVISENFFDREWTERELNEFLKRQNKSGQKIVLPLLHGVTTERFSEKYPSLESIQAIDTGKYSKEEVVILFARELIKRLKQREISR